jgi:hypothetical protein
MSRKLRVPKAQVLPLPSPSWTYELLVGERPGVRLRGWIKMLQGGQCGEPDAATVWAQHREALIGEAEAHGFEPGRRDAPDAVRSCV